MRHAKGATAPFEGVDDREELVCDIVYIGLRNAQLAYGQALPTDEVVLHEAIAASEDGTRPDLPVGTRAKITGFDERGIVISKDDGAS